MNTNTPAQAQEALLTDDQIEALAKKHIAPHADRLDAVMQNPVPYQQTEQFRRVKALIVDVLSKLRAPVADERAAFEASYRDRYRVPAHVPLTYPDVPGAWEWWQRRAALASAPVAGEAHRSVEAIDTSPEHVEESADHRHDAAPQASEAVDRLPNLQGSSVDRSAELQGGTSEAVRDAALDRARSLREVTCKKCGLQVISSCGGNDCPTKDRYADLRALSAQPGAQKDSQ